MPSVANSNRKYDCCLPEQGEPLIKDPEKQRKLKWIFLGLTYLSWVFTTVAVFRCSFVKYGPDSENYKDLDAFGLFGSAQYSSDHKKILGCISYDGNNGLSSGTKAARGFGVMSFMSMTTVLLIITGMTFFPLTSNKSLLRLLMFVVRLLFIWSFVCLLLMFSIFSQQECSFDNVQCVPGGAGVAAIFNIPLLIALIALSVFVTVPEKPLFILNPELFVPKRRTIVRFQDEGTGIETVPYAEGSHEKEELTDDTQNNEGNISLAGSENDEQVDVQIEQTRQGVRTVKTVTYPDGSKTITTTYEDNSEDEHDEGRGKMEEL